MTFCRCSAVAYGWCAQAEDIVQRAHYPGHLADKVGGEKRLLAIYFLLVHEIELQRWLNQQKALHNATVLQKNYILRDLADPHTSPYPPEPTPNNRELQQRDCILTNPNVLSKNARDIWSVLHSFDRKSVQHLDWISFFGGSPSRDADFGDFGRWRIRLAFWSAVEQQNSVEHVSLLSEQICSKRNASRPRWAAAMPGSATTTQSRFAEVDRRIRKRHLEMYNVRPVPITGKNHYCENRTTESEIRPIILQEKLDLLVCSMGGVFSSVFFEKMKEIGVRTNDRDDTDLLKHPWHPPIDRTSELQRAIFIYGDVFHAVASLFRRRFHYNQSRKLSAGRCEIPRNTLLHYYLRYQVDALRFEDQLAAWTTQPTTYDILFLNASTLLDHERRNLTIARVCAFLGRAGQCFAVQNFVPRSHVPQLGDQLLLEELYGKLNERLHSLPDCFVLPKLLQ